MSIFPQFCRFGQILFQFPLLYQFCKEKKKINFRFCRCNILVCVCVCACVAIFGKKKSIPLSFSPPQKKKYKKDFCNIRGYRRFSQQSIGNKIKNLKFKNGFKLMANQRNRNFLAKIWSEACCPKNAQQVKIITSRSEFCQPVTTNIIVLI